MLDMKKFILKTTNYNSIAKGYAVDRVANLIESNGYGYFLVDIGGEITSSVIDSDNWIIGIQNPSNSGIIKVTPSSRGSSNENLLS